MDCHREDLCLKDPSFCLSLPQFCLPLSAQPLDAFCGSVDGDHSSQQYARGTRVHGNLGTTALVLDLLFLFLECDRTMDQHSRLSSVSPEGLDSCAQVSHQ